MVEIRKLGDALGAEVSGLDLSQPLDGEAIWHADMTYTERPPMAAILYRTQIRAGASAVP